MRLPPLNALRAFEAAARHEGFVGAAEELHVTRGAISRHVKLLEDHLGTPLFRRTGKGVTLTEPGRRLLPVLTEAFRRILEESTRVASGATDLRILCPPGTSIRWLIPRLEGFRRAHPDIRIRLTTDFHSRSGFDGLDHDLGFSVENWPNRSPTIETLALFPILMTPACTPAFLERHRLDRPADLARVALLHEGARHGDWRAWLAEYGGGAVDPDAGDDFPNLDLATRAAVMGTGVVMADLVLNRDEFDAGTLVRPFPDLICESPLGAIILIGERDVWDDPRVRAFRDWADRMAAEDRARLGR